MHRTRNAAYGQPYRGFESLPLRHPSPCRATGGRPPEDRQGEGCLRTAYGIPASVRGTTRGRLPLENRGPSRATACEYQERSLVSERLAVGGRECARAR